jgi:phospholipase C
MRTLALLAALLAASPALADSASCPFATGDLPAVTLPSGAPHGAGIPIDTIVVLMQENRSFDHYFGHLHAKGVEAEPRKASNPDPTGGAPIRAFHTKATCEVADLDHSWNATHKSWHEGAMDGFTAVNVNAQLDPNGHRTMGYHTAAELPLYYKLYRTFAIGDRYFASLLGPTFPNRFYLLSGTSFGEISNRLVADVGGVIEHDQRSVFNLLDEAVPPVTWKVYVSLHLGNLPFTIAYLFTYIPSARGSTTSSRSSSTSPTPRTGPCPRWRSSTPSSSSTPTTSPVATWLPMSTRLPTCRWGRSSSDG